MSGFDFTGLTRTQQGVLSLCGWSPAAAKWMLQPSRKQMKPLIDRGLVVEREVVSVRGGIAFTWFEYDVPIAVHIEWCAVADELYTESGRPRRMRSTTKQKMKKTQ